MNVFLCNLFILFMLKQKEAIEIPINVKWHINIINDGRNSQLFHLKTNFLFVS